MASRSCRARSSVRGSGWLLSPGNYSYLMSFIEGGEAAVAGEADEISGVVADDEAMTLTVTLSAPYANFPFLTGFQTFMPTPEAAVEAGTTGRTS